MSNRIFLLTGLLSIALMIYFIINPQLFSVKTLVWVVTILYSVLIGCIQGYLSHSLSARQKGSIIIFPVLMGALFAVMAFIYIFLILPLMVPGFLNQ